MHAEDFLERGKHANGLAGKLADYLHTQKIPMDDLPYALLTTARRFCGVSFNPISFWCLYDHNKRVATMIFEVNNTFDERRTYFIQRNEVDGSASSAKFRKKWDKNFHVSAFNGRDGHYSLSATDLFKAGSDSNIDTTIVLSRADNKPKLIARIFSRKPGVGPRHMATLQTYWFLARRWRVGFMTNPRILREARILWAKNLQVFCRPEVLRGSIGRIETREQTKLEPFFHDFLCRLGQDTGQTVTYIPAAGAARAKRIILLENSGRLPMSYEQSIEINHQSNDPCFLRRTGPRQ